MPDKVVKMLEVGSNQSCICIICSTSTTNGVEHEYNFSSMVSSTASVKDILLQVITDIKIDGDILKDSNIINLSGDPDYLKSIPICSLCFKRFCDYNLFSAGLLELRSFFKTEIQETHLKSLNSLASQSQYNDDLKCVENKNGTEIDKRLTRKKLLFEKHAAHPRYLTNVKKKSSLEDMLPNPYPNVRTSADNCPEEDKLKDDENDTTKNACENCGMLFKEAEHLKTHMSAHQRRKPFACDICKKGFTRKASLLEHIARHQGMFTNS